jgi:hypothetical protein
MEAAHEPWQHAHMGKPRDLQAKVPCAACDMDQAPGILGPQLVRASASASPRASSYHCRGGCGASNLEPGIVTATFLLRLA